MSRQTLILRMVIVLLALLGIFDAAILLRERSYNLARNLCVFETACETLRMSDLSAVPAKTGLPVPMFGILGFGGLLILAVIGLLREQIGPLPLTPALLVVTSIGVGIAALLLARQFTGVGTFCIRSLPSGFCALGSCAAALIGFWDWGLTAFGFDASPTTMSIAGNHHA